MGAGGFPPLSGKPPSCDINPRLHPLLHYIMLKGQFVEATHIPWFSLKRDNLSLVEVTALKNLKRLV